MKYSLSHKHKNSLKNWFKYDEYLENIKKNNWIFCSTIGSNKIFPIKLKEYFNIKSKWKKESQSGDYKNDYNLPIPLKIEIIER